MGRLRKCVCVGVLVMMESLSVMGMTIPYEGKKVEVEAQKEGLAVSINNHGEAVKYKAGLKEQKMSIWIVESGKFRLVEGELNLQISKDGAVLSELKLSKSEKTVVSASDNLDPPVLLNDKQAEGVLSLNIKRTSKMPAVMVLDDIDLEVNRTVAEGGYDLVISGSALGNGAAPVIIKDAVQIKTPSTGISVTEYIYKAGEKQLTCEVDNCFSSEKKGDIMMDVVPFMNQKGQLMVPLKYLPDAVLKLQGKILSADNGSQHLRIDINSGEGILTYEIGELTFKKAVSIPLEVKSGRIFVSAEELGYFTNWYMHRSDKETVVLVENLYVYL